MNTEFVGLPNTFGIDTCRHALTALPNRFLKPRSGRSGRTERRPTHRNAKFSLSIFFDFWRRCVARRQKSKKMPRTDERTNDLRFLSCSKFEDDGSVLDAIIPKMLHHPCLRSSMHLTVCSLGAINGEHPQTTASIRVKIYVCLQYYLAL